MKRRRYKGRATSYEDTDVVVYEDFDPETGELETRALADYNTETHRLSRRVERSRVKKKSQKPFVRIFDEGEIMDSLTFIEEAIFFTLAKRLSWESGLVVNKETQSPLTLNDLSRWTHMDKRTLQPILEKLADKGIIGFERGKGNSKNFFISPEYAWRGYERNKPDVSLLALPETRSKSI